MEIKIVQNILAANDAIAQTNRQFLRDSGVFTVNMLGSPGSGKTSLVEQVATLTAGRCRLAVIEGDIATDYDAQRVAARGVPVVQIATGGECHLDAPMVQQAMQELDFAQIDVLLIENVGNLVCPAEYDLGESARLLVSSVPEGDDKVEKYPLVYRLADGVVLNKTDLLGAVDFSIDRFRDALAKINPSARFFPLSCRTGEGLRPFLDWLLAGANAQNNPVQVETV